MVVFKQQFLRFLFGGAEPVVLENSRSYFNVTAVSHVGFALYYAGAAAFRAMGNSRIPFVASVSMMAINLLLKYLFIFHMNLEVMGAGEPDEAEMYVKHVLKLDYFLTFINAVILHHL